MTVDGRRTRVSIIFPYLGDDPTVRQRLADMIAATLDPSTNLHTSNQKPILVVNKDTIRRGLFDRFRRYIKNTGQSRLLHRQNMSILEVWSVDTCQMWLDGFGRIVDDKETNTDDDTSCVLQIPGDLKYVGDFPYFLNQLGLLAACVQAQWDFAIGDFEVEPQGSKYLIDLYGTYPLLFNWFPKIARELQALRIKRPRTEFLAARVEFLKHILTKRKFAYEQTLAILIHALSERCADAPKRWLIGKVDLGKITDYAPGRGFREANDQIERTERMLKLLWREQNGGDQFDVREFETLARRSQAIGQGAIVSLENFLRQPAPMPVARRTPRSQATSRAPRQRQVSPLRPRSSSPSGPA
jgi:hypothetical protein